MGSPVGAIQVGMVISQEVLVEILIPMEGEMYCITLILI